MKRINQNSIRKLISLTLIFSFVFYCDTLYSQAPHRLEKKIEKAKNAYNSGRYNEAKTRLERIIDITSEKGLRKKEIFGECYLLLGAIYEKKNALILATENYQKAKGEYSVEFVEGVNDLDKLDLYRVVVKGEIEEQFRKAIEQFNLKQYATSLGHLEWILGIINKYRLNKREIMGKCYLLLGAVYEKLGHEKPSKEYYTKVKDKYNIEEIKGINFKSLPLYWEVVKSEKPTPPAPILKVAKKKSKKKSPILLVVGGIVVIGVLTFLLLKKKKQYRLNVNKGTGVDGSPNTGTPNYNKGTAVNYNYSLKNGYSNLVVTLDDATVASSGTITMDGNHTLTASSTQIDQYTLNVIRGEGVDGTPASGTITYNSGDIVNYSYSLQSGYTDLVVQLDGATIPASGNFEMIGNRILTANASSAGPLVSIDSHTTGSTVFGTINITGTIVSNKTVRRVELWVDNENITSTNDSETAYSLRWNTIHEQNGIYSVKVVAYDSDNFKGESQISINVDNIYVEITNPQKGAEINEPIDIIASASSLYNIEKVEFYRNETMTVLIGKDTTGDNGIYRASWDPSNLPKGDYTISAKAYNNTGRSNYHQIKVTVK